MVKTDAFYGRLSAYEQTRTIIGIDSCLHNKTTGFSGFLRYRSFADVNSIFTPPSDVNSPACIPGIAVLFSRDPSSRYNAPDSLSPIPITITSFPLTAKGALERAGTSVVTSKTFILNNVVQTGCSADWENIYLPFNEAQSVVWNGRRTKKG